MDMHQGQMCKLRRRMDGADIGLYIRLRSSDGAQRYYRIAGGAGVNQEMGDQMIAFSDVDATNNNRPGNMERPYVVTCIVPSEIQAKVLMVNPNVDVEAEVANSAVCFDISRERKTIEKQMANIERQMQGYRALQEQMESMKDAMSDLDNVEAMLEDGQPVRFTYVFGRHPTSDKEFCWRLPTSFIGRVALGMRAVGDTAYGPKAFTVTRIEVMERLLPHRLLLSVEEDHPSDDL